MYARLRRLYKVGRLDKARLQKAVVLGWITEEEMQAIIDEGTER